MHRKTLTHYKCTNGLKDTHTYNAHAQTDAHTDTMHMYRLTYMHTYYAHAHTNRRTNIQCTCTDIHTHIAQVQMD